MIVALGEERCEVDGRWRHGGVIRSLSPTAAMNVAHGIPVEHMRVSKNLPLSFRLFKLRRRLSVQPPPPPPPTPWGSSVQ